MRIPLRRAQILKPSDEGAGDDQITAAGLDKIKKELAHLEMERPAAIEEVDRTRQFGDFSENAEYQDAKFRLRRINARIDSLKDRIMRAVVIQKDSIGERVELGSTVTVKVNGQTKKYEIVGPRESNPSRGRISHVSPLGGALLHHQVGHRVMIETEDGQLIYQIEKIS